MSEISVLKDPSIFPSSEIIKNALDKTFSVYSAFVHKMQELNINTEWRFYNDGKEWLGKNTYKGKTIFWLSIYNDFFKVGVYFNDKNIGGVLELPIDDSFKVFVQCGKLSSLIVNVTDKTKMDDLYKVIEYKRNLK